MLKNQGKYTTVGLFQVLISERQSSTGLLEVLDQTSDLSIFRDALTVSVISTMMYLCTLCCILQTFQIESIVCLNCNFFQKHNLTDILEESTGFTIFAPTDSAIQEYLKRTGEEILVLHTRLCVTQHDFEQCIVDFVCLFLGFECDPVSHYCE